MDGIDLAAAGQIDDCGDVQIGSQGAFVDTNTVGLVCPRTVQAVRVFFLIDRNRAHIEVIASAEDAKRNLSAVGNKDLLEFPGFHGQSFLSLSGSRAAPT